MKNTIVIVTLIVALLQAPPSKANLDFQLQPQKSIYVDDLTYITPVITKDKTVWISNKEKLYSLKFDVSQEKCAIKLNGTVLGPIVFFETQDEYKGLVGTSTGWAYVLGKNSEIIWAKKISRYGFPFSPQRVTENEYRLVNSEGELFSFDSHGNFLESKTKQQNLNLQLSKVTTAAGVFSDGTMLFCVEELRNCEPSSTSPILNKIRFVKPDGSCKEFLSPQLIKHTPGIIEYNGQQVAVLFGAAGLVRFLEKNGLEVFRKQLNCEHDLPFVQLDSKSFAASGYNTQNKKTNLVLINSNETVNCSISLPSEPSSNFLVFTNFKTGKLNLAGSFADGHFRTIDPHSGTVTSDWTQENDDFGGSAIATPVEFNDGFLIQKGDNLIILERK